MSCQSWHEGNLTQDEGGGFLSVMSQSNFTYSLTLGFRDPDSDMIYPTAIADPLHPGSSIDLIFHTPEDIKCNIDFSCDVSKESSRMKGNTSGAVMMIPT